RYAGAMLAPYCEEEAAEALIRDLGVRSIALWSQTLPGFQPMGSLVIAQPRDRGELERWSRMTIGHARLDAKQLAELEPDLAERFSQALFYEGEAHLNTPRVLDLMLEAVRKAGVAIAFGSTELPAHDLVIDCRGLAARDDLPRLRGVRGERAVIRTREISLSRPVRLLHPRFPIYVVPWGEGKYLIGATQIESEETGPATVRSALELFSTAYGLHPAFGEAEILDLSAGVRPAFPDNKPAIVVRQDHIYINGLFRHGFLLAPALAELVAEYVEKGVTHPEVFS
ncbi:MAG: FAD-dependent oxidoreductase, partial [Alphaproteobacteria bacterium]